MPEEPERYSLGELTLELYGLLKKEINAKRVDASARHLSRIFKVDVDPAQVIALELERVESRVHTPPKKSAPVSACLWVWMKRWATENGRVSAIDARPKVVSLQSSLRDGGSRERLLATQERTAEETILDGERARALDEVLVELKRDSFAFQVLQLRIQGVMKPANIADQLACPVERVYRVIQKNKEAFRKRLQASVG